MMVFSIAHNALERLAHNALYKMQGVIVNIIVIVMRK